MVVVKCPMLPPHRYDDLLRSLTAQAKNGVILLPVGCELVNEVPADEEIKVVQQTTEGPDVVTVPAAEWQHIADYIRSRRDCATCAHRMTPTCCPCYDGSMWKWRYGHGKE